MESVNASVWRVSACGNSAGASAGGWQRGRVDSHTRTGCTAAMGWRGLPAADVFLAPAARPAGKLAS